MRTEKDSIGKIHLPEDYLFGAHTNRAEKNFHFSEEKIQTELFASVVKVKKACVKANLKIGLTDKKIAQSIDTACDQILEDINNYIPGLNPFQGGAGTSINMAANELIANKALINDGRKPGEYHHIHPLNHVNLSQSTNDVFMTSVKIAILKKIHKLHDSTELFLKTLLSKEKEFSQFLKIARTELQDAMPISLGQEFGAWAEAVSRFRWRLSKAVDWIREVNIGGTAVGTSINADPAYISFVIEFLRNIAEEPLSLSRNLVDGTQNADQIIEVSGIIRTGAVTVKKIASDIRLLSSGPETGFNELVLPHIQSGSSIMPGKINPVMPEAAEQVCLEVMGGDSVTAHAASQGNLELQQFLPLIAHRMIKDTDLFSNMLTAFSENIKNTGVRKETLKKNVEHSFAVATLLAPEIGFEKVEEILEKSRKSGKSITDIIKKKELLTDKQLEKLISPDVMASPGLPLRKKTDKGDVS
ncbi:MAG: aspartate ammonia-lyase [bacterium]